MRQQQFDVEHATNLGAGVFQVHAPPMEPNEDYKGARKTCSRIGQEPRGKSEIHASESTSESLRHYCLNYVVICKNVTWEWKTVFEMVVLGSNNKSIPSQSIANCKEWARGCSDVYTLATQQ